MKGKWMDWSIFKRMVAYAKPYKLIFYFTAFLTISLAFIAPIRPYLIQNAFDKYIYTFDNVGLLNLTLWLIGLLILESIFQFFQTYFAGWIGQSVIKDLRKEVFDKILHFRLKYFDQTPIGTMVTRAVSDIETIAEVFSQGLLTMIGDLLKLIVVVIIMFVTNPMLALISLVSVPLLLLATYFFKNAIKSSFQQVRTQVARLNDFVQEHIIGMGIVQVFGREEREQKKFAVLNAKHRDAHIKAVWAYSIFFPVVEILTAFSLALLVWWGAKGALAGRVTIGELVAFILYIYMLFRPIRQLADRFNVLQMGMVSSERVFKVLDRTEKIDNQGSKMLENPEGLIAFKKVWFAYKDENWVLRNISFDVKKGQTLAIVGATGSGKTSIINLISRFYTYQKGQITIDGLPIEELSLESLRKTVGLVSQDVFLFSDTVFGNVVLDKTDYDKQELIKKSKEVGAHSFIEKLPGGYDFNVQERGASLSVGQRQLLSFLRAYVQNPPILILDEATSSLDSQLEYLIQKATQTITQNRTSIVIAHRLSTIQQADTILVMDNGEIKEQGSHQQLLEKEGIYRNLYDKQYAHLV